MKIALVQDGLMCRGGGEQVALCFHKAFPNAPIYTLCYKDYLTFPEFKDCDIRPSWLQYFVNTDNMMKNIFFPFGIWAMKSHDLREYDVVLMSGTHCAKYVRTNSNALVISYSFTPFRLAWEPLSYPQYAKTKGWKRAIFSYVVSTLRKIDKKAAQRPDYFIAMTDETSNRLKKAYEIDGEISIIKPPVKVTNFDISMKMPKTYFLVVSRLEYYKKVDLVVKAFNRLKYPLIIVGKGTLEQEIKSKANQNIKFLSGLSVDSLAELYANCRALVFPQHEDYGITPLEANACGRPVIAYGVGGVRTTQKSVDLEPSVAESTAIFFDQQTVDDLVTAVKKFELIEPLFDSNFIRNHAMQFDESNFIKEIRKYVTDKYNNILNKQSQKL